MTAEDKTANYAQSGFHHRLEPGKRPALLIIDFVAAYLQPDSPLYAGVEDVRDRCVELLGRARELGLPVFHTNVRYTPGGADGGVFYRKLPPLKAFDAGSPLGAFAAGLEPRDEEPVFTKQYASAFFGTSLAAALTAAGIDTVVIGGLTTSGCVRASAVDAMQHGFIPIVVRDCVGDRHPDPHEANLFDLEAKYALVMPLADTLAYLDRPA